MRLSGTALGAVFEFLRSVFGDPAGVFGALSLSMMSVLN